MENAPAIQFNTTSFRRQVISLFVLGLLGGLVWRLEIELRFGWLNLDWIGAFHISGVLLPVFGAIWLWVFVPAKTFGQRLIRSVIALACGLAAYVAYATCFGMLYSRLMFSPVLAIALVVVGLVVIPWVISFFGWCFTPFFSHWIWLILPVLFFAGVQLAIFLLRITGHRGGADVVHAVKSGFLLPLWIWAAGIPFLWRVRVVR